MGIRQIENYNVDAVQHIMRVKAEKTYKRDLIDVEVQMISKSCTAVKKHLREIQKKREAKKWPAPTNTSTTTPSKSRKELYREREIIPLWKRMGKGQ